MKKILLAFSIVCALALKVYRSNCRIKYSDL